MAPMKNVRLAPVWSALVLYGMAAVAAFSSRMQAQTYTNPVLFADYSDPDAIRDGNTYYLVASTFSFVPGLPILSSKDLVHWSMMGHAVTRLTMAPEYDLKGGNRYGGGVWAPSLRKHGGLFYIYFPTPGEGIFVTTAKSMAGPWSAPVAVIAQAGLEDPCPFWDDDGNAYLVHSKKGAGPLILHRMSPDGMRVLDDGKEIVHDPKELPTLEGPKLYKRNGFYYIFAPFGGVSTGAQAVLRSRSIYGPYEHRTVLAQGDTAINGPHQGAWVQTPSGEGWFLHFQSRGAHGRIVHLEPVRWEQDWPIIGQAAPGATVGQPVITWPVPRTGHVSPPRMLTSDEFEQAKLQPQWEWNHNPESTGWSLTQRKGFLRLHSLPASDLLTARNTLTECMQDDAFEFTARLDLSGMKDGDHVGLSMFEKGASGLEVVQDHGTRTLGYFHLNEPTTTTPTHFDAKIVQLRVHVDRDRANFSYSDDEGKTVHPLGQKTTLTFSWWKGSRPSVFSYSTGASGGWLDVDWVHYQPLSAATP
jgi:beta-xylosidase